MSRNNFASACYDGNTIEELIEALTSMKADESDCKTWDITPTEWRQGLGMALSEMISDILSEARTE